MSELDIPGNAKDDRRNGISRSMVQRLGIPGTVPRRYLSLAPQLALWESGHHLSVAGGQCVILRKHLDRQGAS